MGGGHLDLIWKIREGFLEALIVLSFYYLGKTEETYAETWKAERERHL